MLNYEHELHAMAWNVAKDHGLEPNHVEEIKERLRPMFETQYRAELSFRTKVYNMMRLMMREFEEILNEEMS